MKLGVRSVGFRVQGLGLMGLGFMVGFWVYGEGSIGFQDLWGLVFEGVWGS